MLRDADRLEQTFCDNCSKHTTTIPNLGFAQAERVCDDCLPYAQEGGVNLARVNIAALRGAKAPELRGFLFKQGDKIKSWKRRFFLFDGIFLKYFAEPTHPERGVAPKGSICLREVTRVRRAAETESQGGPRPNMIAVEIPSRVFLFRTFA
jgi:hypothetical protein